MHRISISSNAKAASSSMRVLPTAPHPRPWRVAAHVNVSHAESVRDLVADIRAIPHMANSIVSLEPGDLQSRNLDGTSAATTAAPQAPVLRVRQGCVSVKGLIRQENQDRAVMLPNLAHLRSDDTNGDDDESALIAYCAVFDGHGGSSASTHAAQRLHEIILANQDLWTAIEECNQGECKLSSMDLLELQHSLPKLLQESFLNLDGEILEQSRASGCIDGATAVAGVHSGPFLFVANAGDSRAVLCRGGKALRLTRDHKPDLQSELTRIEAEGGCVKLMRGVWRVLLKVDDGKRLKMCATCRGLGDLDFKQGNLITCEPEVTFVNLQPELDAFTIFASDGLWGFSDDQRVVDTARQMLSEYMAGTEHPDMVAAAEVVARRLVKHAQDRGSDDDISVVVNVYDWTQHRVSVGRAGSHRG